MYLLHLEQKDPPGKYEKDQLDKLLHQFHLPREKLERLMNELNKDFNNGLSISQQEIAHCKMLPTYVHEIPDGIEDGNFFALDLGGTNFRILLVQIKDGRIKQNQEKYSVPPEMMTGAAENLFGYLAECLASFAKKQLGNEFEHIEAVGFTFSFPVKQESLTHGTLTKWTKGFDIPEVVGKNVVQFLNEAITQRNEISVGKIYLINDTVGVMMCGGFHDPSVVIGLILGTGTNACYMEDIDRVKKWTDDIPSSKQVIINMEWGAFGEKDQLKFISTMYDDIIDANSLHPGHQLFEKMISGMYLGEIARLCLVELIQKYVIFNGILSNKLQQPGSLLSEYVSKMCGGSARLAVEILDILGYPNATIEECLVVQDIFAAVSRRSATLASAGLAAIIRRLNKTRVSIAIDGSLYKYHPTYKKYMYDTLDVLLPDVFVKLRLAEDGSGKGAALVAATAHRIASK